MTKRTPTFDPSHEYTAEARHSGGWWALSVPELPGVHSQVRRLEQGDAMIRDAISLAFDVPASDVKIHGPIPVVNPTVDELIRTTQEQRAELVELRIVVDILSRRVAHEMADEGIPVRDIASVLDVSFQHAAKLAKGA